MTDIIIYTDGACSGNPGPGGWGFLIQQDGQQEEYCGGDKETTNNRMEMMAATKALEAIPEGAHITLVTDSKYVMDGITKWVEKWKKNNWRTADKKPVKNKKLWERLDAAAQHHTVQWKWVKGHSNDRHNDRADALANEGMQKYL